MFKMAEFKNDNIYYSLLRLKASLKLPLSLFFGMQNIRDVQSLIPFFLRNKSSGTFLGTFKV